MNYKLMSTKCNAFSRRLVPGKKKTVDRLGLNPDNQCLAFVLGVVSLSVSFSVCTLNEYCTCFQKDGCILIAQAMCVLFSMKEYLFVPEENMIIVRKVPSGEGVYIDMQNLYFSHF